MKLYKDQKKTISGIFADLGKLIFLSIVVGKFISTEIIPSWLFITGILIMFILFTNSIMILKELD